MIRPRHLLTESRLTLASGPLHAVAEAALTGAIESAVVMI
jgi:hypothetical protein